MKTKLAFSLALLFFSSAQAIIPDTPSVLWRQYYNCHDSGGAEADFGILLEPNHDNGGLYVGGVTNSLGPNSYDIWDDYDACVIKLDSLGKLIWYRTFGIKGNGTKGNDNINALCETADGGVIAAASTSDTNNLLLAKFGPDGSQRLQKTISVGKRFTVGAMRPTSDGGFIMTGGIEGDRWTIKVVWIVKFDSTGTIVWEKKYSGGNGNGIGLVPDHSRDSFIVVADMDSSIYDPMYATTTSYNYAWLLKIDSKGDTIWTKRYSNLNPVRAAKAGDSDFIIAGTSDPDASQKKNAQIAKFSFSGDSLWARSFTMMDVNYGRCITSLGNGDILFGGTFNNKAYTTKGSWIICLGPDGDSLWSSEFINSNRTIYDIYGLGGENYAVTGGGVPDGFNGSADIWVMKCKNGTKTFENFFGGRSNDFASSLIVHENRRFIFGLTEMYNHTATVVTEVNDKGEKLRQKEFPFDIGNVFKDTGDTLLLAGIDSSGFFWSCTDTAANLLWKKTVHHDTSRSYYYTCFASKSGGYYLVGDVNWDDGILIRLDDSGKELWSKTYEGYFFYDGLQQNDGNLVLLTESAQMIGTDTLGNINWITSIPTPESYTDGIHGTTLVQTKDGGLTAFCGLGSGPYHQYIYRTDSAGNFLWSKIYDNKYPWDEKVKVVNDNEYLIAGATVGQKDKYIAYLDARGAFKWEKTLNGNDSLYEEFSDFCVLPSGDILAVGSEQNKEFKDWDIFITELGKIDPTKIADDFKTKTAGAQLTIRKDRIVFNFGVKPFQDHSAAVGIFSLDGKCVYRQNFIVHSAEIALPGPQNLGIPSGIYFIKIKTKSHQWIYKYSRIH